MEKTRSSSFRPSRSAALAALLVLSTTAFAQTFEAQVSEASAGLACQARQFRRRGYRARGVDAPDAATNYARTIFCPAPPDASGLPAGLRFYTRLGGDLLAAAPADETAAQLDDYRSTYLEDGKYHYDTWSCDTIDYYFSFDAGALVKASPLDASRPVKGHARVETRGYVIWEGDMDCVAGW